MIAKAIIAAATEMNLKIPLVVRLQGLLLVGCKFPPSLLHLSLPPFFSLALTLSLGNNQKKARALLESSGQKMLAVEDFDSAAKTVSHRILITIHLLHSVLSLLLIYSVLPGRSSTLQKSANLQEMSAST